MANLLNSILALANDKAAALQAAAGDVATASQRVILHGDAALFSDTASALEARKGSTAAGILGRMRAAWHDAVQLRNTTYPEGRKGKATAEQSEAAKAAALPLADAFKAACIADSEERSNKAKAAQQAAKAKKANVPALPVIAAVEMETINAAPASLSIEEEAASLFASHGVEKAAALIVALQNAIIAASGVASMVDISDAADLSESIAKAEQNAASKAAGRKMKKAA
jgi:protein-disulfide isomerase-like protein with CxxC motif